MSDADATDSLDYAQDGGEEEEEIGRIRTRSNWETDEDHYFQWARYNRRPLEFLAGRKRNVRPLVGPVRVRRINGGLWRSGLVG